MKMNIINYIIPLKVMAEQVPTPSTALDKLHKQLTCPVCLSQFESPKTLPCLHSFCLKCIQQLPVDLKKGKHVIRCPTCRKTAQVPNKGPADLPTALSSTAWQKFKSN